jgi:hypothetical protein
MQRPPTIAGTAGFVWISRIVRLFPSLLSLLLGLALRFLLTTYAYPFAIFTVAPPYNDPRELIGALDPATNGAAGFEISTAVNVPFSYAVVYA